jgi:hypothetical protein
MRARRGIPLFLLLATLPCPRIGDTIVRLGIVAPSGGFASYPGGGTPQPVHVAGGVTASSERHYQGWYRNAAPFCTPSPSNLTQGLTIAWAP